MWREFLYSVALGVASVSVLPGAATALSVHEVDLPSGEFGSDFHAPSLISAEAGLVTGRQNWQFDRDYLYFEGFEPGTRSLDFTFTNQNGMWGTFQLQLKYLPFSGSWEWRDLAANAFGWSNQYQDWTYTFTLPDGHTGPLFALIRFTSGDFLRGNGVEYQIGKTTEAETVVPAPLPPALPLTGAAIAVLALLRRSPLQPQLWIRHAYGF